MRLIILFLILFFLIFMLVLIGVRFDYIFLSVLLQNLLASIIIIFFTILIIDNLYKKEKHIKYKRINNSKSDFVFFLANRIAFKILNYLELYSEKEFKKNEKLTFEFAVKNLEKYVIKIDSIFIDKINNSSNKKEFIDGFSKIIIDDFEKLKDELDKIQPQPNPIILALVEKIHYLAGNINSADIIIDKLKDDEKLTDDQLKLIEEICFKNAISDNIKKICKNIIEISEKAKNNELFVII